MGKYPLTQCARCAQPIPDRPDRQSPYCRACIRQRRCLACGQLVTASGDHQCATVDLKGTRSCQECGVPLANTGYERWKTRCPRCEKKRWRAKEKAERLALKYAFGGACARCGYNRCNAALQFHHVDGSEKRLYSKGKGSVSLREIRAHPTRFILLCANCHFEEHASEE